MWLRHLSVKKCKCEGQMCTFMEHLTIYSDCILPTANHRLFTVCHHPRDLLETILNQNAQEESGQNLIKRYNDSLKVFPFYNNNTLLCSQYLKHYTCIERIQPFITVLYRCFYIFIPGINSGEPFETNEQQSIDTFSIRTFYCWHPLPQPSPRSKKSKN